MFKKIFIGILVLLVMSAQAYNFASTGNSAKIELNGVKIQNTAYVDGKTVYLPLRAVGEALGYTIDWSQKDCIATISKAGKKILIDLKNSKINSNGHIYYMSGDYSDTDADKAIIREGKTYLRIGFFTDNLGLKYLKDSNGGIKLESIKENSLTVKTVKEASESKNVKISIQYPQIEGLADKKVQAGINSVLKKPADTARSEAIKNADELAKSSAGSPNKCEVYFDYRMKYNQNGLLSVVFTNYQYSGGAHGQTVQSSYSIDLKTGTEYKLQNLMNTNSDYVKFINKAIATEIAERVKEEILPDKPLNPFKSIKQDQSYYLSNNALVIYFQQYEYYPYAAGIQEFPVYLSDLKNMFKTDFDYLNSEYTLLKASPAVNSLNVGEIGRVVLKGNATTGYTWHYTIENSDIVKLDSSYNVPENNTKGLVGAGSIYTWNFKCLKEGQTKVTFKYYREWEGEASTTAANTIEYLINVKP